MNPINFNYPPNIAVSFIDDMVERANNDPNAKPVQRAIFEDIKTLVHLAMQHLMPEPAPAHGGTVDNKKS